APERADGAGRRRADLPARATDRADAREARDRAPGGRRLALRAEVGRLPRARVPRPRSLLRAEPRPPSARPVFPRAGGGVPPQPPAALRGRRRDRDRDRPRPRLRRAPAPAPPGGVARAEARRRDAGVVRRLRPARPRPARPTCAAAGRAPPSA